MHTSKEVGLLPEGRICEAFIGDSLNQMFIFLSLTVFMPDDDDDDDRGDFGSLCSDPEPSEIPQVEYVNICYV